MDLKTLKTREDILIFAKSIVDMIDRGYPIQVMVSPVEGAFMTPAQRGLYYKYLHKISLHTGETVKELDEQVKMFFFGDPEMSFSGFSIEEFSAFLSQFIPFAEEQFGCLVNLDNQTHNQIRKKPSKHE